jgi:hypothetical protein
VTLTCRHRRPTMGDAARKCSLVRAFKCELRPASGEKFSPLPRETGWDLRSHSKLETGPSGIPTLTAERGNGV